MGVDWQTVRDDMRLLIASPEKAIVDSVFMFCDIKTPQAMLLHLTENMRIDSSDLNALDKNRLKKFVWHLIIRWWICYVM